MESDIDTLIESEMKLYEIPEFPDGDSINELYMHENSIHSPEDYFERIKSFLLKDNRIFYIVLVLIVIIYFKGSRNGNFIEI